MFAVLLRWELCKVRRGGDIIAMLAFFGLGVCLFGLALRGVAGGLAEVAGGILWVLVLLSLMLCQQRIFADDREQGVLADLLMRDSLLWALVYAKIMTLFLATALPLLLFSLLAAIMLQLPLSVVLALVVILALGLWGLCFLIVFGAALMLGVHTSSSMAGVLLPLLVLPLALPVLIFGEAAIATAATGAPIISHLAFLAGYGLFNMALCPPAVVYLLRANSD